MEGAFGGDIDYAILHKVYGASPDSARGKYSPAECIGTQKHRIEGEPDLKHVSTSYVERSNLAMRKHMRRFTRLTNGFSKKVENHAYAVALHMMYYNFVQLHSNLRTSPALAAGVTDKLWEIWDIVALVEAEEAKADRTRDPYKIKATVYDYSPKRRTWMERSLLATIGLLAFLSPVSAAEPATIFKRFLLTDTGSGSPIGQITGTVDNLDECNWTVKFRNEYLKADYPQLYPLLWCEQGTFSQETVHPAPKNSD